MSLKLTDIIGPSFYGVHDMLREKSRSSFWLRGGRGSLKSSFAALEIVIGIVQDKNANCVAFRKVGSTLKDSVMPTFEWAIDKCGWSDYFQSAKSREEITYLPTGQKILMRGLDDEKKIKSIKTKVGYFKYLWFEEGAEYASLEEMESVRMSVLRGGTDFVEFVSYNPPAEPFAWINEESRRKIPGRYIHESNFRQSPPEWLGPKFLADAAEMEKNRPEKFAQVYMGVEIGRTDAIIFSGCYKVEDFNPEKDWDGPYFGADFGFSNDPNVLVKCWIKERNLYIEHEEYGYHTTLDDMPAMYDKIPEARKYKIRADCSRPETIAHLHARGFKIEAAEKWQGSIEDGITVMKSFNIVLHPRCTGILHEFRSYRYKIDRLTQDVTADIIDKDNHGVDAIRYALAPVVRKKNGWFM